MTKLAELAATSIKAGVRLQELDDALLDLVTAEYREAVRVAIRLRPEFSDYLHNVADAVEFCEQREAETPDTPTVIIKEAVAKFGVTEKSLDRGWIRGRRSWEELAALREYRKKSRT